MSAQIDTATSPGPGVKALAVGRSDLFKLKPEDLHILPEWNSRDAKDPENVAHIERLALSISQVGVKQPFTAFMKDGKPYISDGNCRRVAIDVAREKYGTDIKSVDVRMEDRYASEADILLSQIVRNSGKEFSPLEQGRVFKRLLDFGWSVDEVADKAGKGKAYVSDLLTLQAAGAGVTDLVSKGAVSATLASSVLKKAGGDTQVAAAELKNAVKTAAASGKTKATAKHTKLKAVVPPALVKAAAKPRGKAATPAPAAPKGAPTASIRNGAEDLAFADAYRLFAINPDNGAKTSRDTFRAGWDACMKAQAKLAKK